MEAILALGMPDGKFSSVPIHIYVTCDVGAIDLPLQLDVVTSRTRGSKSSPDDSYPHSSTAPTPTPGASSGTTHSTFRTSRAGEHRHRVRIRRWRARHQFDRRDSSRQRLWLREYGSTCDCAIYRMTQKTSRTKIPHRIRQLRSGNPIFIVWTRRFPVHLPAGWVRLS